MGLNYSDEYSATGTKTCRITRAEEKLIQLLKDNDACNEMQSAINSLTIDTINNYLTSSESYKIFNMLNDGVDSLTLMTFFNIFACKKAFTQRNTGRNLNLTIVKRMHENEYDSVVFARANWHFIVEDILALKLVEKCKYFKKILNLLTIGASRTFEDLLEDGFISSSDYRTLMNGVAEGKSVIISGELCSGKTTLLNAILHKLNEDGTNVILIDDISEIQINTDTNKSISIKKMDDLSVGDIKNLQKTHGLLAVSDIMDISGSMLVGHLLGKLQLICVVHSLPSFLNGSPRFINEEGSVPFLSVVTSRTMSETSDVSIKKVQSIKEVLY